MNYFRHGILYFFLLLILLIHYPALATEQPQQVQPAETIQAPPQYLQIPAIRMALSAAYLVDTDMDNGNSFSLSQYSATVSAHKTLNSKLSADLGGKYAYESWEFANQTGFGGIPWKNIHQLGANLNLQYRHNQMWSFFVNPNLGIACESDADYLDSLIVGSVIGATYATSPKLYFSFGGAIFSAVEKTITVPVFMVNWVISDAWRLSMSDGLISPPGQELVYSPSDSWDIALGVGFQGFQSNRFRLDDTAPAPDGIGEVTGYPLWLRSSFSITPQISIDLQAGYLLNGEVRMEDEDGHLIHKEDFDPAPFGILTLQGRL